MIAKFQTITIILKNLKIFGTFKKNTINLEQIKKYKKIKNRVYKFQ